MNDKMLKALTLVLTAGLLQACSQPAEPDEDSVLEEVTETRLSELRVGDVEIIELEGCEYIVFEKRETSAQGYGFMTHKGNCKNPIHVYRDPLVGAAGLSGGRSELEPQATARMSIAASSLQPAPLLTCASRMAGESGQVAPV